MTVEEFVSAMGEGIIEAGGDASRLLDSALEAGIDFEHLHKMSDKWAPMGYPTAKKLGELLVFSAGDVPDEGVRAAVSDLALLRAIRCPDERQATGMFEVRAIGATFLKDEIPEGMLEDLQIEGMEPGALEEVSGATPFDSPIEALSEGEGVVVLVSLFPGFSRPDAVPDFHWRLFELQGPLFDVR